MIQTNSTNSIYPVQHLVGNLCKSKSLYFQSGHHTTFTLNKPSSIQEGGWMPPPSRFLQFGWDNVQKI